MVFAQAYEPEADGYHAGVAEEGDGVVGVAEMGWRFRGETGGHEGGQRPRTQRVTRIRVHVWKYFVVVKLIETVKAVDNVHLDIRASPGRGAELTWRRVT